MLCGPQVSFAPLRAMNTDGLGLLRRFRGCEERERSLVASKSSSEQRERWWFRVFHATRHASRPANQVPHPKWARTSWIYAPAAGKIIKWSGPPSESQRLNQLRMIHAVPISPCFEATKKLEAPRKLGDFEGRGPETARRVCRVLTCDFAPGN